MHLWRHSKDKYKKIDNSPNPVEVLKVYEEVKNAVASLDLSAY
jgi:hypothetical protein